MPGTLLGERYRIVSLLGVGGMGEVYRATDLRLGQQVALKFLPEETARDPKALARFHTEVRIARQVAHPNVCRVYDIGEVEGHPYLSMEYVDGEDLHSLLRRIGRLPSDKAIEIARKLCAGLAAAHDRGVLHRDLKPANIMIDGRGHVLITDFGLAGIVGQIEGVETRNGTPGYMAPEQLSGKEVSAQSDIFALGIVLYEMFTGKRPYETSTRAAWIRSIEEGAPPAPRSIVRDIEPSVENVILQCLSPDPRHRPQSALAVSAALPGGDLLAAALAAGETPSPEMVAASGQKVGLKPNVAMLWLAGVVAGIAVFAVLDRIVNLLAKVPFDHPPEVLAQKARDIFPQIGYSDREVSNAYGFSYRVPVINYVMRGLPGNPWERLAKGRPATILFWYRASPVPLVPREMSDVLHVTPSDPPEDVSGMLQIALDPQGRLLRFVAVPPRFANSKTQPVPWNALFQAAALDPSRFQPADPVWTPPVMSDTRMAWNGTYSEAPGIPIHVEAAGFQGKPVYFTQVGPWVRPSDFAQPGGRLPGDTVYLILQLVVVLGSIPFARYNLRLGRGDTRAAFRLGLFATCVGLVAWLIGGSHVANTQEGDLFFLAAMRALFGGVTMAITYISLEPFVRRKWPQTIISWSRVLTCGFRDPLVGKDILVGAFLGVFLGLIQQFGSLLYLIAGIPAVRISLRETSLLGGRYVAGQCLFLVDDALYKSLGILFLIFLARMLLKKQWLAAIAITLALAPMNAANALNPLIGWPVNLVFFGVMVFALMRFGLVTLIVSLVTIALIFSFPLTTDVSVWFAGNMLLTVAAILAVAFFGFRTAVAGQALFKESS